MKEGGLLTKVRASAAVFPRDSRAGGEARRAVANRVAPHAPASPKGSGASSNRCSSVPTNVALWPQIVLVTVVLHILALSLCSIVRRRARHPVTRPRER